MIFTELDLLKIHNLTSRGFNFGECLESVKIDKLEANDGDKVSVLMSTVSLFYNLKNESLVRDERRHNVVEARRMFCYLCRMLTNKSLSYIGNKINRDHATVMHHFRKQTGFVDIGDKATISDIEEITKGYFINLKRYEDRVKDDLKKTIKHTEDVKP